MKRNISDELKGSVRTIRTEKTVAARNSNENNEVGRPEITVVEYDERGKKIKVLYYKTDGGEPSEASYEYDEAGNLIFEGSPDKNRGITRSMSYQDGLLIEENWRNFDAAINRTTKNTYDQQRRLVYSAAFNENGTLSSRREIIYNRAGDRTEESFLDEYSRDGQSSGYITDANNFEIEIHAVSACYLRVKYSADKNPISAAYYDCGRSLLKKYEFVYDSRGYLRQSFEYLASAHTQHPEARVPFPLSEMILNVAALYYFAKNGDYRQSVNSVFDLPLISQTYYHFNHRGKLISEDNNAFFGQIKTRTNYQYGKHGELLSETWRGGKGEFEREKKIEWEFDEQGNWTKQVEAEIWSPIMSRESPIVTTTRTIEYFA